MTQPSASRSVALATLVLLTMIAVACGRTSPVAPDTAAARTHAAATTPDALAARPGSPTTPAANETLTFPLSSGTFTIANRKGEQISGIYSGESKETNGVSVTTLRLEVQRGTGNLAGATGVLEGKGRGAFISEGQFSLDVSGALAAGGKKDTKFSASLQGWSNIACEAETMIISMHADGARGAKSSAEMRHEVGNAGCSIP